MTGSTSHSILQEETEKRSRVLDVAPADVKAAAEHFSSRLAFETDPSDVHADLMSKVSGIIVVDARTPEAYARGHVPGAINLPHRKIDSVTTSMLPRGQGPRHLL